jgi:soluble lytic murein transglycosylase
MSKMKGQSNIILFVLAVTFLVIQALFASSINSVTKPYVFKEQKSFETPYVIYEAYIEIHKKELELDRIGKVLTGYRGLRKVDKSRLAEVILEESKKHNLDPMLILALIETESSFRKWARSRKGARGLMQIRPFVGRALAKELNLPWKGNATLYDPYTNVQLGTYYFSKLLNNFSKDVDVALTAYNYGPTYVKHLIRKGKRIPERYANRVITNYRNLLPSQL